MRLLIQVLFDSEKSSSYQSGITGQLRRYKFHLLDAERLRPFAGFLVNVIYKDTGRAEYASAPNYLLRVEQADQICGSHAPHLDSFVQYGDGNRVFFIIGTEHIIGRYATDGFLAQFSFI